MINVAAVEGKGSQPTIAPKACGRNPSVPTNLPQPGFDRRWYQNPFFANVAAITEKNYGRTFFMSREALHRSADKEDL